MGKKNNEKGSSAAKKKAEARKKEASAAAAKQAEAAKKEKNATKQAEAAKKEKAAAKQAEAAKKEKAAAKQAEAAKKKKAAAKQAEAAKNETAETSAPDAPAEKPEKTGRGAASVVLAVISIVLICIFVPVIVLNTVLIVKGLRDTDRVPTVFGYGFVAARADSMTPVFAAGDLIVLRECDPAALEVDDIISFYTESVDGKTALVTRRVAAVVRNDDGTISFRSRSDETGSVDNFFIPASTVAGTYVRTVPRLGAVMDFMTKPQGVLLFAVVPLCLLFLADGLIFRKAGKNKNDTAPQDVPNDL